jgi:hypothetical protein
MSSTILNRIAVVVAGVAFMAGSGCGKAEKTAVPSNLDRPVPPPTSSLHQPPPPTLAKADSRHLAPGSIRVRIGQTVDSSSPLPDNAFVLASVAEDVKGVDSQLAIPAGASALLKPLLFSSGRDASEIALSLYSVDVGGHQYQLVGQDFNPAVAVVKVDSVHHPENKTVHINEGAVLDFMMPKPAQLR